MKNRMVNTRFWQDTYVSDLDPVEKLLFLYCLTNNYSTLCGIYELPIRLMAAETGIDKDMIEKIFARFTRDGKMLYRDGWVVIRNFIKHHEQGSPKVRIGIEKDLENAPDWAKSFILGKGIDTLSPSASASASASHDSEATASREYNHLGAEIIKAFEQINPACKRMYGNKTQRQACDDLIESYGLERVLRVVDVLPQTNGKKYVPTITTPLQLRDGWVRLESALKRKKEERTSNCIII